MSDHESDDGLNPSSDVVLNKYKMAGEVTNTILAEVISKCVAGSLISEICKYGDIRLLEETSKLFKKNKDLKKGIAFPTSICVNNIICCYSPIDEDKSNVLTLNDGDMVKIELGAHVDGFAAVTGHTLVIGASPENKVSGAKADVMMAAYNASEAVLRLMRPGNNNYQVTEAMNKISADYSCKALEGMQSHQMKQHTFDAGKAIISNPTDEQKKSVSKVEFEEYDCWLVDVFVSSGDGKVRDMDVRSTIYKRNDSPYRLKMKASRQLYHEISQKFMDYPFNIRHLDDINKARLGMTECVKHDVVQEMRAYTEKESEFVAQFKTTVLVMPNGPVKLTGLKFEPNLYKSEFKVKDNDMKALLSQPIKLKKKAEN